ncbi:MAG: hypothetical protein RPU13_14480, partial [Candidatus Sedimenticola sp. (ex Thyasira tokunagai)]
DKKRPDGENRPAFFLLGCMIADFVQCGLVLYKVCFTNCDGHSKQIRETTTVIWPALYAQ